MTTTTKSRKARGRNLQKYVVKKLRQAYGLDQDLDGDCYNGDVQSVPMGMSKEDILLSPYAKGLIRFSFECKAQEKLNIWKALEQAESNADDRVPVVVFKRNRSKVYVCLEFDDFLDLVGNDE